MTPLPDPARTADALSVAWPLRLHAALMPDYNRKASVYWWVAVTAGAAALAHSLAVLANLPAQVSLQVAVGMGIAMLAGIFPVRVPHSRTSFAVGEIFIFLLMLMHGPEPAALAAAGEAAVISYRTSKRWTSRLASPAMAGLGMLATGTLQQAALGALASRGLDNAGLMIIEMVVFAIAYFVVNTLLVTTVQRLRRNQRLQLSNLFDLFGWVGIAYVGSATVAVLLYLTYRQSGIGVLMAMVPLLAMMLATLHYYFGQQEVAEAMRLAAAEAGEREQELATRHVRELESSERRFHNAFTHASIGNALLAFDGRVLQANPALRALLGQPGEVLIGQYFQDHVTENDRAALAEQMRVVSAAGFEAFALELRCRNRDGDEVWVATHCTCFSEPGDSAPCLILQVQDITARRKAEIGLHHVAFHDSLTGLPNRRRFHDLLGESLQRALQEPRESFAVMFLDFDRFKLINDSLGHTAGDTFLVQVSQRIRDCLRPQDVVARLGGDEFAVLVRHLEHECDAVMLAERLLEAVRQPFLVAGTELTTSASIGITFSSLGYTSPEDVLRDADTAMYKAKAAGKARCALFDASLHTEVAERLRLEGELRRTIDEGRLSVEYQPVYNLTDGRLSGFEALVRWQHPSDGAIDPSAFLPIAEEAGLMLRLTDFVLHCACRQLREWQQSDPAHAELTMNVNVSGNDVAHAAFVARVTRAIVESGLQARHLCLELTENILMSRLEGALQVLGELRRLGVMLAIDDFGTGYSSLSHLSTLPIDCLKIDRSFVMRLGDGSNEAAVVRSIILLGNSLGKLVVAEGIETQSQLAQLREMGCRMGQGYLLARPASAQVISYLLGDRGAQMPLPAVPDSPRGLERVLH